MKKKAIIIIIAVILVTIAIFPKAKRYLEIKNLEKENRETIEKIMEPEVTKANPDRQYLEVPFICQAPLQTEANWVFHEESCEEAAILMAYLHSTNQVITREQANEEIFRILDWEKANYNGKVDIYADEIKNLIVKFYGINPTNIEIIYDADITDVEDQLAKGYPVITPITASILDNPFYGYQAYHMLIAIGYTEDKIVTNDNGTRRGKDFSYDKDVFEKAMQDAGGDIIILKKVENPRQF